MFLALLKRNRSAIRISKYEALFFMGAIWIGIYSLTIVLINNSSDYFETLRFLRATTTYCAIGMFIYRWNVGAVETRKMLEKILFIHAICIIAGVVYPEFKQMTQFISGFEKAFSSIRSTGLTSSYEGAGFLCIVGLLLNIPHIMLRKKKMMNYRSFIYVVAIMFTSRTSITVLALVIIIIFLYSIKLGGIKGILNIIKYVFPILCISALFIIITTNFGSSLRDSVYNKYPMLRNTYEIVNSSYTDYGVHTSVIERNISIDENLGLLNLTFGSGYRVADKDPGYIKTLYSIGFIGILMQITIYITSIKNLAKVSKNCEQQVRSIATIYMCIVLCMFILEFKMVFVFSSTYFELLSLIYLSILNTIRYNKNRNTSIQ